MKNKLFKMFLIMGIFALVLALFFNASNLLVFAAESEEIANEAVENVEVTNTLFNWLQSLNMDDIRSWVAAIFVKLGIDTTLIISCVIYIVRAKIKEAKQTAFYNELLSKLDEKNAKKVEEIAQSFDAKLEKLNNDFSNILKKQNAEKREEAKATVDQARAALSDIKITLDE